jgi:flavin reductase (DIM6/NTAB) family NADH-FMN oxidoreductase RutF
VHFLTEDDLDLAEHFGTLTGDDVDKFDGVAFRSGVDGVPLIERLPHRLLIERSVLVDEGGDHVCVVGGALDAEAPGRFSPLRLSGVDGLVPGHEADERADPPTG